MKKYVIMLSLALMLSGCAAENNVESPTEAAEVEVIEATEEVLAEGMEKFESRGGFSVVYPANWVVQMGDNVGGIEGCEFYVEEPESESNISIAVYPFDPYINEMTKDMVEDGYKEAGYKVEVTKFFRGLRHGMKTVEMEFEIFGNKVTQISFVDNDVYYSLVYTEKDGITEEDATVMQGIIDSVKKNG